MKEILKEFKCMNDYIEFKNNNKNLKEAGLWERDNDNGKVYCRMIDLDK